MIVRMWKGLVPKEKKAAYIEYLHKTGLSDYGKTPGNKGVFLLCRDVGGALRRLRGAAAAAVR